MAYSKKFKSDAYLVNFMGGMGKGVARAGNSLINLGNDKIKNAEKDAAKKEFKAKEARASSAINTKNRALNPVAVKKFAGAYGIDENSPLYKKGAPSKFNADLGLVDLGKGEKAVAPKVKSVVKNGDGTYTNIYTDGSTSNTKVKTPAKTYKKDAPIMGTQRIGDKNYITKYNDKTKKYENTGRLTSTQPASTKSQNNSNPNFKTFSELGLNYGDDGLRDFMARKGIYNAEKGVNTELWDKYKDQYKKDLADQEI